ncbi:MAG: D-sedoheptulose 7-phosphate isomerase [Nitrospira sp.]|nr:D-sedoheptulose 7-phosphate isomerase [Nitrospira sp.]
MKGKIETAFQESAQVKIQFIQNEENVGKIMDVTKRILGAYRKGNKVLFFGNGGSACDASHLAAELVNRYKKDRDGLPALALATDMAVVTSIGNDYDYTELFSRQIKAMGNKGDVAIAISTSGNSPNVLKAVEMARQKGLITVGFTGKDGGKLAGLVDYAFIVPSDNTARIQEAHITLGHLLCELIEDEMFK